MKDVSGKKGGKVTILNSNLFANEFKKVMNYVIPQKRIGGKF